jgi:hypothetical protein
MDKFSGSRISLEGGKEAAFDLSACRLSKNMHIKRIAIETKRLARSSIRVQYSNRNGYKGKMVFGN